MELERTLPAFTAPETPSHYKSSTRKYLSLCNSTAHPLTSPHAERVALASFPSLVPLLYFVCLYRFTAPALAFIAARPQLSAGFPIDSRWSPKIYACMPTASGIPTRSPIMVLTRPGEA